MTMNAERTTKTADGDLMAYTAPRLTKGDWMVHIPRKECRRFADRPDSDTGIEILEALEDGGAGGYQTVVGHVNCQPWKRILSKVHAEEIVTAHNAHKALGAACEAARQYLCGVGDHLPEELAQQLTTALALAQKEA